MVQGLLARSFFGTPTRRKRRSVLLFLLSRFRFHTTSVSYVCQRSVIFTPCSRKSTTVSRLDIGCPYRCSAPTLPVSLNPPPVSIRLQKCADICSGFSYMGLQSAIQVKKNSKKGDNTDNKKTGESRHRFRLAEDIIPHLRSPYTTCSRRRQPHQTTGVLRVRHARQPICRARDAKVTSNSDRKATATAYPPPLPLLPFFSPVPFSACAGTRSPAATHPTAAWWTTTTSPSTDSCELKPNRSL